MYFPRFWSLLLNKVLSLVFAKYNLFMAFVKDEKLAKGMFNKEKITIMTFVRPPQSLATSIKL